MSDMPPGYDRWKTTPPEQPEWEECRDCGGTGSVRVHGPEDYGVSFESEECETCDGTGKVPPPTREEIAEIKAEQDFDRLRDEGRI